MTGQHPLSCSSLREVAKAWRTMVAAATWVLAFLWTHGVTSDKMASSAQKVLLWWQRTFWSIHWLRCLNQLEPMWLTKESHTCHSVLELCVTWETATTCREQCLARVMLLVIPELNKVGSGLSLFSWSHREECHVPTTEFWARFRGSGISLQNAVLCLAEWGSDGAVDTSLIWVITAWTMSSLESVN